MTEFMTSLKEAMVEGGGRGNQKISASSANLYIKGLRTLNGKKDFNDLKFLKDIGAVLDIMNTYSLNYKKSLINSVLSALKVKPQGELLDEYVKLFQQVSDEIDKTPKNKLNEKQKEAYMEWDDVLKIKSNLMSKINKRESKLNKMSDVIDYFILSLYTDIPPRRNKDYTDMVIVKEWNDNMDKDLNYLDMKNKRLVFNNYKTAKTYGQQVIDFKDNDEFNKALKLYLRQRGIKTLKKGEQRPFLITTRGTPLTSGIMLNRTLNRIFGRSIGATMLRHIYLTNKYGKTLNEMKNDAMEMGHSLNEQREYIVE